MKQKHKKLVSLLSKSLPESFEIRKHTDGVYGRDIPKKERERLFGDEKIDENKVYQLTGDLPIKIDHYKRLKKAYSRNKTKGVIQYIEWLNWNQRSLAKKHENVEQVPQGIMDALKGGVMGFWGLLAKFLFAFVYAFGKKKDNLITGKK